ncbi:hypothetical protein Tco_1574042, partial [Tanacetum coccineum]
MTSFNKCECTGCGQPCDGFYCYLCACPQCGVNLLLGTCLNCTYGDGKPVTCCGNCGGPHETFQCQPLNQNLSNSNSSCFDQFQPSQYPVIHHSPQETSEEVLQAREDLMKAIYTFLRKFSRIPFGVTPKLLLIAWERFSEIKHAFADEQYQQEDIQELMSKLLEDFEGISNDTCDVPVRDDSSTFDVLSDHYEILSDFNDDGTSSNDDDFEDI